MALFENDARYSIRRIRCVCGRNPNHRIATSAVRAIV
jgi:hypothetical protein